MFSQFKKIISIFSLLILITLSACNGNNANNQDINNLEQEIAANFDSVISATGKVVPAQWATISSPSPGIILSMSVIENQFVSQDQELLRLSGSEQISAMVSLAELELLLAEQAFSDFIENAPIITAQAQQSLANAEDNLNSVENTFDYLIQGAKQSTIDQAEANMILRKDQLDKARENFEKYEDKPKDDLIRAGLQSILGQAQVDYDRALRLFNNLNSFTNDLELAQGEANVALALAILNKSQLDYEKVEDGPDSSTLNLLQTRVFNAESQLLAAQTALDDLIVKAPFSGIVSQIYVNQNEWVNPSQPILILGDLSKLQVETTDLNEIDVAHIRLGQTGTVKFDALIGVEIKATVVDISSKSSPGTGVNYKVTLELEEIPEGLLWNMTAFIDIIAD